MTSTPKNKLVSVESLLSEKERAELQNSRVYQVVIMENKKGDFVGCFPLNAKVPKSYIVTRIDGNFKPQKVVHGG